MTSNTEDDAKPRIVDPAALPTLRRPSRASWAPSEDDLRRLVGHLDPLLEAYAHGLKMSPCLDRLTQLMLEMNHQPIIVMCARFGDPDETTEGGSAYFARSPEEVQSRIAEILTELRQAFIRLEAVTDSDRPQCLLDSLVPVPPTPWESLGSRRRRQPLPRSILLFKCGSEQHRVSLPSRGPIVLLDHPDRQLVEAMLARKDGIEGCL